MSTSYIGKVLLNARNNNQYQILAPLGQGSFGQVFLGEQRTPKRKVAIKRMDQSPELIQYQGGPEFAIKRFFGEAAMLMQLNHPNIPKAYDFFAFEKNCYIVLELIEGYNLLQLLADGYRFSLMESLEVGITISNVFRYLHKPQEHKEQRLPIIYRDAKLDNIMKSSTKVGKNKYYSVDFSIARYYKHGQKTDTLIAGNVFFSPPEINLEIQTNDKSDIFTLGVTLLVLIVGDEVSKNSRSGKINIPDNRAFRSIPPRLKTLLLKMVEQERVERPNAYEVWRELVSIHREL